MPFTSVTYSNPASTRSFALSTSFATLQIYSSFCGNVTSCVYRRVFFRRILLWPSSDETCGSESGGFLGFQVYVPAFSSISGTLSTFRSLLYTQTCVDVSVSDQASLPASLRSGTFVVRFLSQVLFVWFGLLGRYRSILGLRLLHVWHPFP